jgi:hypothetical protein
MNTPLAARWASFSRSFSRSNCISHYLIRMPSVPSSFKCDVSGEMNYMALGAWSVSLLDIKPSREALCLDI